MGREMYCIRRGLVEVIGDDDITVVATLGPGAYFGEVKNGLNTMRRDATRRDATRRDAMRCDAMRCDAMRCDAMRCDAMRYDTILYSRWDLNLRLANHLFYR